jgi:hypothetical protein
MYGLPDDEWILFNQVMARAYVDGRDGIQIGQ